MSKNLVVFWYLRASSTILCFITLLLILNSFLPGNTMGAVWGAGSLANETNAPLFGVLVFASYLWLSVKEIESCSMY